MGTNRLLPAFVLCPLLDDIEHSATLLFRRHEAASVVQSESNCTTIECSTFAYVVGVPQKRSTSIQIRLTPAEKKVIDRAAEEQGFVTAGWARSILLREAKRVVEGKE